ncbi:MAG: phosphoenolpyruvate--protein phosphotransferase [Pedosphaera sp.]|nr:phosphoenolpyruvate--protein phosphotransferase [Pedosphaera sp.]
MPANRIQNETIFRGIAVSPGVCRGTVLILERGHEEEPLRRPIAADKEEEEVIRLQRSYAAVRQQILQIQEAVRGKMQSKEMEIFDAHVMILDDPVVLEETVRMVREQLVNVEFAYHAVVERYAEALAEVGDEYLRERAADLRDVCLRVLNHLLGRDQHLDLRHLTESCILVSHDLAPTQTAQLDRRMVLGLATDVGGKTSHTAILANSLRIPAVVGLQDASLKLSSGDYVLLDGLNGIIIVNPTDQTLYEYGEIVRKREDLQAGLLENKDRPAVTLDGTSICVSVNIDHLSDILAVHEYGAEGIGLFRTEYLFLERETLPTEEEQFISYHRVATAMKPQEVILRTLDIGGDKNSSMFGMAAEENPFLGLRAIRLCLQKPEIFRTQLRAILRASVAGNIKLMYPMISGVEEIDEANRLLETCKEELRREGMAFDEKLEVGVMIEIPSAVMMADALGRRAKFFSIGTNDLIQYSLAVDRLNERIAHLYDPAHPGLLRLIQMTVESGKRNGIWTSVCGEMAADPTLVPLLLGLGVTKLSVSPIAVPAVKHLIRCLKLSDARELAEFALLAESSVEILARSRALVQRVAPGLLEDRSA